MLKEDKDLLQKIAKSLSKEYKIPCNLTFSKKGNEALGEVTLDDKIVLYENLIEEKIESLDSNHLPNISLEVKKKLLYLEILSHEFTHLLLNRRCNDGKKFNKNNQELLSLIKYTEEDNRRVLIENTTVLDDEYDIDYLSGNQEFDDLPMMIGFDGVMCLDEDLHKAHEFAAHLGSQVIMDKIDKDIKNVSDEWTMAGKYRKRCYDGLSKYIESKPLSFLHVIDFIKTFDSKYKNLEKNIGVTR